MEFRHGISIRGKRTVVVVEHIGIAITDHSLPAWGIGLSIRAVDKFAAACDEILAGLVCEWPTGTLRASNADGISEVREYKATSHWIMKTYS